MDQLSRRIVGFAVNAEGTLELAPDLQVVSIVTVDAVDNLRLKAREPKLDPRIRGRLGGGLPYLPLLLAPAR